MSMENKDTIQITKYGVAVIVVVLLGAFLRLYDLDRMAYHHDESIHAFYSHNEYKGDLTRAYDPTYHGQFLYHIGAFFFLLFGDSDSVGRLPFAAFGLLMLYFVWRLKPYLGKASILTTLLIVAFSPTLCYFSRFARNDIYMGTMALGVLIFALDYLRTTKSKYLVGSAFFLALMYTCKENSYMTGFFFGSFAVFFGVYYFFSYPREVRRRALDDIFNTRAAFAKILTLYGLFSCAAFSFVHYVSHSENFRSTATLLKTQRNAKSYDINVLRDAWTNYMQVHPTFASWGVYLWIFVPVVIALAFFLIFDFIAYKTSPKTEKSNAFSLFAKNYAAVVVAIFVMFAVYIAMFTNFGYVPKGMKSGVVDYLLYWMGQQGDPRIPGPPDYYLPRLLVYEPLLVLIGVLAFVIYTWKAFGPINFVAFQIAFCATVYAYWSVALVKTESPKSTLFIWLIGICISMAIVLGKKFASLLSFIPSVFREEDDGPSDREDSLRPDGLRAFFLYWSVFSLLIYALLEEKVPWLMVHQVVPLALLAGAFIGDLWKKLGPGSLRTVFSVLVAILLVYEARTAYQLVIYRSDDPRELLVYTQTDRRLLDVVEEIKEGAVQLGPEYQPPYATKILAAFQGTSTWPYVWYFRNYKTSSPGEGMPAVGVPFAVVDMKLQQNMKVWGKGQYVKRELTHRGWWPPALQHNERAGTPSMRHEMPFQYASQRNMKPSDGWNMLWKYIVYRQVWNPLDRSIQPVGEKVLFYKKQPLLEPEAPPQVAAGYEQPIQPLQTLKTVGKFGRGESEFIEPRGVALSPDQSKLYVLDSQNGRIQVFDKELNFVGWFGGPGKDIGHFLVGAEYTDGPNGGIGVGPDGTIFATDTWAEGGGRINRYSPDGKALPPLAPPPGDEFFFPRGLAVTRDGTLYVADTGKHRIVKFTSDGTYAGAVVKGQLQEPVGVTVGPNGWIYVCDVGMKRIAAFTQQGIFIRQWSVLGWTANDIPWIEPYVTVDARGYVYATDSTKNIVHRFDPNGAQVRQAGGSGSAPYQLRGPKGITIDSQGTLYIADSNNHRIVKARIAP